MLSNVVKFWCLWKSFWWISMFKATVIYLSIYLFIFCYLTRNYFKRISIPFPEVACLGIFKSSVNSWKFIVLSKCSRKLERKCLKLEREKMTSDHGLLITDNSANVLPLLNVISYHFSSAIAKTYSPDRLTSRRSITELFLTIKMPKTIYPCNFLLAVIIFSVFSVSQTKIKYRNRRVISPYKRNKSWIISNSYLPWHFVGLKPAAWWNLVMYGLIFLSLLGSGPTLILSSRQNAIGVITNKCKLEKTNNILSNCMV